MEKIASLVFDLLKAGLVSQDCEGQQTIACFSDFKSGVTCV